MLGVKSATRLDVRGIFVFGFFLLKLLSSRRDMVDCFGGGARGEEERRMCAISQPIHKYEFK